MKLKTWLLPIIAVLSLVACGDDLKGKGKGGGIVINNSTPDGGLPDDGGSSDDGGSPDMSDTVPDATMSSEDAPTILELESRPSSLSEGESVTISAVVTDPQGVEDLVAGRLLDGETQVQIGTFQSLGGGAFEVVSSWGELDAVRAITFASTGTSRAVTAEFIDAANERATRSISIRLECDGSTACGGECGLESCEGTCLDPALDYDDSQNCGACGNTCPGSQICDETRTCAEPPETGVGAPCDQPDNCDVDLTCFDEQDFSAPGGYCTTFCFEGDECPAGSTCILLETIEGPFPICGDPCTSGTDCRSGYSCLALPTVDGTTANVCAF